MISVWDRQPIPIGFVAATRVFFPYHRGIISSYSIGPPGRWLPASEERLQRRRRPFFSDEAENFPLPPPGSNWCRISANYSPLLLVIPRRSVRHGVEFLAFLIACAPASANHCHLLSSNDSRKSDRGKLTIPSLVKKSTRQGFSLASLPLDRVLRRFPAAQPRKTYDSVPLGILLLPPAPRSLALLTRQTEVNLVSPGFSRASHHY
jgi:hypothetical protein